APPRSSAGGGAWRRRRPPPSPARAPSSSAGGPCGRRPGRPSYRHRLAARLLQAIEGGGELGGGPRPHPLARLQEEGAIAEPGEPLDLVRGEDHGLSLLAKLV